MSGFEAANNIRPQRYVKYYRLARKKTGGYVWAVFIMFILVGFLCVNNFMVLQSYKEIRNNLEDAYKTINNSKAASTELIKKKVEIEQQNARLVEENRIFNDNYTSVSRGNENIEKELEKIKNQNSNLLKKNKELVDDNIALQNSLKMAASVGVKPQNYSIFESLQPRNAINKGKYIGKFLGTAYTPSSEECGNNKGITNSGKPIVPGVSVAIDTKYWPYGTVFYIKGLGYAVAMDKGSAIKGKYRFDFSVFDKKFAQELGLRKWDVFLVRIGDGSVKNIEL